MSHPTWVRGLKREIRAIRWQDKKVAPYVGAWIETCNGVWTKTAEESHPTWVRGLKPKGRRCLVCPVESHPTWVRGLKLFLPFSKIPDPKSHPTWVRGLKQNNYLCCGVDWESRTLRGCVD